MPIERTLTSIAVVDQLRAADDAEVFDLAAQIEELTAHPGWVQLWALIDNLKDRARAALEDGPTKDAAQYARELGWLSGIRLAPEAAGALIALARELEQSRAEESTREA